MLEFQEWVVSAISSNIWGYQPIWSIFHYPNAKGLELLIIFHISRRSILDIAYKLSNLSKEIFAFCYLITVICILAQLRASWLTQLSLDRGKHKIYEYMIKKNFQLFNIVIWLQFLLLERGVRRERAFYVLPLGSLYPLLLVEASELLLNCNRSFVKEEEKCSQ